MFGKINNLLDAEPPATPNIIAQSIYASSPFYDRTGRYYIGGVRGAFLMSLRWTVLLASVGVAACAPTFAADRCDAASLIAAAERSQGGPIRTLQMSGRDWTSWSVRAGVRRALAEVQRRALRALDGFRGRCFVAPDGSQSGAQTAARWRPATARARQAGLPPSPQGRRVRRSCDGSWLCSCPLASSPQRFARRKFPPARSVVAVH